jgi:hypothetical protein
MIAVNVWDQFVDSFVNYDGVVDEISFFVSFVAPVIVV